MRFLEGKSGKLFNVDAIVCIMKGGSTGVRDAEGVTYSIETSRIHFINGHDTSFTVPQKVMASAIVRFEELAGDDNILSLEELQGNLIGELFALRIKNEAEEARILKEQALLDEAEQKRVEASTPPLPTREVDAIIREIVFETEAAIAATPPVAAEILTAPDAPVDEVEAFQPAEEPVDADGVQDESVVDDESAGEPPDEDTFLEEEGENEEEPVATTEMEEATGVVLPGGLATAPETVPPPESDLTPEEKIAEELGVDDAFVPAPPAEAETSVPETVTQPGPVPSEAPATPAPAYSWQKQPEGEPQA